ncbi:MAG: Flp pilus assembly complex ATPase component TadA [Acidimicrobiales bacterium]|nr:Flp pilus assembly complex ATPase component TadA [Acidimicrobiales bacterium]
MALRRSRDKSAGLIGRQTGRDGLPHPPNAADLLSDMPLSTDPSDSSELVPIRPQLGNVFIELGLIDRDVLDRILAVQEKQGGFLGALLIQEGLITEEQLADALAKQFSYERASLDKASFDPGAVSLIDRKIAEQRLILAISRSVGRVHIVVADPTRPGLEKELQKLVRSPVVLAIASPREIEAAIGRAYSTTQVVSDAVRVFEARAAERAPTSTAVLGEVDESAPIIQVVATILRQAVSDKASDVHIEPMGERVRVRNRVDGALHEVLSLPQSMAQALVSRIKIMADMNIVERRKPLDGQIQTVVEGIELDVRVSTTPTQHGEKTVLRILDKSRALYDIATLGMAPDTAQVYDEIIRSPYGMVVCAGPTGSGKTTTLYASLMAINSDEINVTTVEDPVEYTFPTINQINIHEQAGLTFASGLRAILRQDPDAILVGEIRDVETARIAIQAALTGHFVLSTIHATDATSALHRFLDMGIESFLLASSMLGVVGQRLIRKSCLHCLEEYEPDIEDLAFYERAGGKPKDTFMKGRGCSACSGTGYSGRIGVYEILRLTNEMRELVVRNATLEEVRTLAVQQGMVPMRDQALRLVADDVTTIAEVMRTIYIL